MKAGPGLSGSLMGSKTRFIQESWDIILNMVTIHV